VRRLTALIASLFLAALVGFAACGSDPEPEAESESADPTASTESGITVSGEVGAKPEVSVPDGEPPAELVVEVLSEGDGGEVEAGDYLVADYLGQTWNPGDDAANVFDNSYDRGSPAGFPIGKGSVITGWDEGLVGQRAGSRVLLVIPPDQAYGDSPPEGSSIEAGSTLVFVVDIVDSYGDDVGISGAPVADLPADMPTVTGEGAAAPTVEFPASATPAETSTTDVLVEGDGVELGDALVAKVLQASYTTKETQYSSWSEDTGPVVMKRDQLPGLADALEGQKVGTRVLVRISAADNVTEQAPKGEPLAIVIDVIGTA
jgi:peptidylprolyl isomerase